MTSPGHRGRFSGTYGRFNAHVPVDQALAALAARQHTVFGLDQMVAVGLSPSAVNKRTTAGRLHRIHQGVYSLVPRSLLTREGHWMAAVLAAGPGAVLSHRSGAALHGLRPHGATRVEVTIPTRVHRSRSGIQIHRSITLAEQDVTIVNGIPCTIVPRTLLDLADVIARRPLERAFDQAEVLEIFDLTAIIDQLNRSGRRLAAKKVRALLNDHYIGTTLTRSALEEAFLALCRAYGLPQPAVNEWIILGDGGPPILADFVFNRQRVVVETDGGSFHGTAQARERDPERDQRLMACGWRPIRTTWRQVIRHAEALARRLARILDL